MVKKYIKFVLVIMITHFITYYLAGIIAQVFLGASEFYPPSSNAIVYLKDPHDIALQLMIFPGQLIRGLLFGLVLLPFYSQIIKLGKWKGSFMIGTVILVLGYLAASGGLIEHIVYFKPEYYPIKFALITLIEITIQIILLSFSFMLFFRKEYSEYK
jgi:hypothetical protein